MEAYTVLIHIEKQDPAVLLLWEQTTLKLQPLGMEAKAWEQKNP